MSDIIYSQSNSTPTLREIREFIRNLFADLLEIDPKEFDINIPLKLYGIDSQTAVVVSGYLQEWLGIDLDPMLLFDHPNIRILAQHLYNLIKRDKQQRRKNVINFATEVFENAEIAEDWLNSPNFALGDKVPYDLLDTDAGIEQVRNLLGRIEYGVYS
jgi:acyl carrier protein